MKHVLLRSPRGAARSGALQTRGPGLWQTNRGPGSAAHHHSASKTRVNALMVLRYARDTCGEIDARHQQALRLRAAARAQAAEMAERQASRADGHAQSRVLGADPGSRRAVLSRRAFDQRAAAAGA